MEINKVADIDAAINESLLVIDLQDDDSGVVSVYDRHLIVGGTIHVKRGNVNVEFGANSWRTVVVECDDSYDVRVGGAMELRVNRGTVSSARNTATVAVHDGKVLIVDDNTRALHVERGSAVVDGNVDTLIVGGSGHAQARCVYYLETDGNAWAYVSHVMIARLRGTSFSYFKSVADGLMSNYATAKVTDSGSVTTNDHAGVHVGGRTYVYAMGASEIIATEDAVVRRSSPDARVQCFDDALVINDHNYETINVVGKTGADPDRELSKRAYKATGIRGYSGERYGMPTKWEVGTTVTADDWKPTAECGHGLHVCRLPGDTLEFLEFRDLRRRPKLFEVQVPSGDDRIRLSYNKDKVSGGYVVREVDIVGRGIERKDTTNNV